MKTITLIASFCLLTCSSVFGQSIFGKWNTEFTNQEGEKSTVQLTLNEDRTYTVDFGADNKIEVNGQFTFSETQLTIWDLNGEYACPSEAKGVYAYTVTQDQFVMTKISDDCEGRGSSDKMTFTR